MIDQLIIWIKRHKIFSSVIFISAAFFMTALLLIFFPPKSQNNPLTPDLEGFPRKINSQGDIMIFENDKFQIVQIPQFNQYIISILTPNFETARQEAEILFLQTLGITDQSQACRLNVTISTPKFVNPELAGLGYKLSFCRGIEPTPTPPTAVTLNPNLEDLIYIQSLPPSGNWEAGGTRGNVYLTFSDIVDPTTAIVIIDPPLEVTTFIHPNRKNELVISPMREWQMGATYTIRLKKGLVSEDRKSQLKEDVVLTYTLTEFSLPNIPD